MLEWCGENFFGRGKMDNIGYCKLMTDFKSNGFKFSSYMGAKWFIFEFTILFVCVLMVLNEDRILNTAGYILFGYSLGVALASVRSFIISKKRWDLQREFLDWGKIEEVIAVNSNNKNHGGLKSEDEQNNRENRNSAAELIDKMLEGSISAQEAIDKWPTDPDDNLLGQVQGLLYHYRDDDDIRAKDERYAKWQEDDFRQMAQRLMSEDLGE